MPSKFLNLSTDNTLGGNNPSDTKAVSEKAVKEYIDSTAVTHTASTAVGSGTQPVYVASNGAATACTYSLNKTVPSNAVFTDEKVTQTLNDRLEAPLLIANTTDSTATTTANFSSGITVNTGIGALYLKTKSSPLTDGARVDLLPRVDTQAGIRLVNVNNQLRITGVAGSSATAPYNTQGTPLVVDPYTKSIQSLDPINPFTFVGSLTGTADTANAVKDQNTGTVKTWTGTKAEYDIQKPYYSWNIPASSVPYNTLYVLSTTLSTGDYLYTIDNARVTITQVDIIQDQSYLEQQDLAGYYVGSGNLLCYRVPSSGIVVYGRSQSRDLANLIDSSTLYFCTDTGQLFKGTIELTSNYVAKSGDIMTGALGITANVKYPLGVSSDVTDANLTEEYLLIKDTSMNLTDTPSANRILGVRGSFNDNAVGDVRFAKLTDGSTTSRLVAFNSISGNIVNAQFGVNIDSSGDATLTIPAYAIHNQLGRYWLPSTTAQTLTRPASGGTVTAPDDGYIYFLHRVASAGQVIALNSRVDAAQTAHNNNQLLRCWIPVAKGVSVTVEYTGTATTNPRSELVFRKSMGATY